MKKNQEIESLVVHALNMEEENAKEAGALGYMSRILTQATLPHRNPKTFAFERSNGRLKLAIISNPKVGIPYGTYPRLILSWLVTEAVQRKTPNIILGNSLTKFMSELSLIPSGGRWGTIWRLRDQMQRLFSSSISCAYNDSEKKLGFNFSIAKQYSLWWDPKNPMQTDIWQSTVTLGKDFFEEIINRPVPIDTRALKALKMSSMALDLYCWMTYRLSYLKNEAEIPWILLQRQFGSDYANTKQGRFQFKRKLLAQLKKVAKVYDGASKSRIGNYGLIIVPSIPHIKKVY